jgi:hypothetical protein
VVPVVPHACQRKVMAVRRQELGKHDDQKKTTKKKTPSWEKFLNTGD